MSSTAPTSKSAGSALGWRTVIGAARADKRTKNLTKRIQPGEIAIIDHEDLDKVSADALVRCKAAAVLNAAKSTSGRYPNLGPQILIDAGIPLIDDLGQVVFTDIDDGAMLRIEDNQIFRDSNLIAEGRRQDDDTIAAAMEAARAGMAQQLENFVANTLDYVQRERSLLLEGVGVPAIATQMTDRPVLIVVRGHHYKEDLAALRPFLRENKPILIGVDGGADAILEAGQTPNLVVGDMDSVSDKALTCGAEIVVHAYRDGHAPGLERVKQLGVEPVVFAATGTSEDIAMLLADDKGASVIVAVGTHNTLEEFLDKGRSGMSSTWITRLRVGGKLVDAKGVSRLYRQRVSSWQITMLALAGLLAVAIALAATPNGRLFYGLVGAALDDVWSTVTAFFTTPPPSSWSPTDPDVVRLA